MASPDMLPLGEIEFRHTHCRRLLRTLAPDAGDARYFPAWYLLFDRNTRVGAHMAARCRRTRVITPQGSRTCANGISLASHFPL